MSRLKILAVFEIGLPSTPAIASVAGPFEMPVTPQHFSLIRA
jgi:hypothetical protein